MGGLSCAALLAKANIPVILVESHYEIGGCAHEFAYTEDGIVVPSDKMKEEDKNCNKYYHFEAGPSLYSGLSLDRSPNPLKHVFQMIDEEPEWITYDIWGAFLPEAPDGYELSIGAEAFEVVLDRYGGPTAISDWKKLSEYLRPICEGVMELPTVAIRNDIGIFQTLLSKYPMAVIKTIIQGKALTRPFAEVYDELDIKDDFLKNYLNLLCFLLQGMPDTGTLSAVMAYMIDDFYKPNAVMDFPKGGSGEIAAALERGILKNGGKVLRRTHVEEILIEDGRAVGVRCRGGKIIKASKGVVSNADLWTTSKLVPEGVHEGFDEERKTLLQNTDMCKSFVHLHLGIDATDLDLSKVPPQWTVVQSWDVPIDEPSNVIVVSVASLLDPSLAPENRHVIHAYTAGNEPYSIWKKFEDKSNPEEYEKFKNERAACLFNAIKKHIPDLDDRTKLSFIGTPITHARFNRRFEGTYGPAIAAGKETFPGQITPLPALYRCGDSTNPGIGVPAVAASGALAAAAILDTKDHLELLKKIKLP